MELQNIKGYVEHTGGNMATGWFAKLLLSVGITIPAEILGVSTELIAVLVMMSIIDFITGIIRSKIKGERISSSKAANTLFKGLMYACLIMASWGVSLIFNDYVHIHYLAVCFLMLVEFHSVLENITEANILLPTPVQEWVKTKLNLYNKPQE